MVPGSTLMYGSNFCNRTLRPRRSNSIPIEAHVSPFPSELTTPPVTKMNLAMRGGSSGRDEAGSERVGGGGETSRQLHYTGIASGGHLAHRSVIGPGREGPVLGHESLIIRGRVHAPAGVRDDADEDRPAMSECAELFQFLQLLQRVGWER